MKPGILFNEFRNGLLECVHHGFVCVVGEKGIVSSVGESNFTCYYRSASKAIQALPVVRRKLNEKYGLTDEETAIISGSHMGDEEHVRVLESIMKKADISEETLIMLPTYPVRRDSRDALLRKNKPPRKIYHNCAGKHMGMILLARELGEPEQSYWVVKSKTQSEILSTIATLCSVELDQIHVGVDGCGVPTYAVPFSAIALSYMRLLRPENITDDSLAQTVQESVAKLRAYPNMVSGYDTPCSTLTGYEDTLGKAGALGVYAMSIKSLGLGIVVKILDGSQEEFGRCAVSVLEKLGYSGCVLDRLVELNPSRIINDNDEVVGEYQAAFTL